MNRKKKINDILKKKRKKANAKKSGNVKSGYVSKADRALLEKDLDNDLSEKDDDTTTSS